MSQIYTNVLTFMKKNFNKEWNLHQGNNQYQHIQKQVYLQILQDKTPWNTSEYQHKKINQERAL